MAEGHASPKTYWIICVVLCVATFFEWWLFQIPSLRSSAAIMIPVLSAMSILKFVLVLGWYMHLRYDNKILTKIFSFSLFLAVMVFVILKLSL